MTLQEIRELIQVVVESGVAELEVQRGDNRVRIRRSRGTLIRDVAVGTLDSAFPAASGTPASPGAAPATGAPISAEALCDPSLKMVNSPIVGTFYECPSPNSPPFVKVGDTIEAGKVVCIIESMKLMNEIEAEFGGTVVSRLVENGQPVEYGEALFAIRPA